MSEGKALQYTKDQVAAALQSSFGIVAQAANKLKCSRQTIYEYLKRYPSLKQDLEAGRDFGLDTAELSLMDQIVRRETAATIFYLKTQGKRRGYIERTEVVNYNVPAELIKQAIEAMEAAGLEPSRVFNDLIAEVAQLKQEAGVANAETSDGTE